MYNDWTIELKGMADRIISMRQQLFEALQTKGSFLIIICISFQGLHLQYHQ